VRRLCLGVVRARVESGASSCEQKKTVGERKKALNGQKKALTPREKSVDVSSSMRRAVCGGDAGE
jgi:hypothetical protein